MIVIPECFYRGSSFIRRFESGFRLKACRNDNFFDFRKRLFCFGLIRRYPIFPPFLRSIKVSLCLVPDNACRPTSGAYFSRETSNSLPLKENLTLSGSISLTTAPSTMPSSLIGVEFTTAIRLTLSFCQAIPDTVRDGTDFPEAVRSAGVSCGADGGLTRPVEVR
jgi:hypothetical protein